MDKTILNFVILDFAAPNTLIEEIQGATYHI
jgi:hypothetical protein